MQKLSQLSHRLLAFMRDRRGVTAIEYGILAAGVAVVIGVIVSSDGPLATAITDLFDSVVAQLPESAGK